MKNVNQVLNALKKNKFTFVNKKGSAIAIIPPNKDHKFYLFHMGKAGLHPLRRFAQKEWNIDINTI